jgi:hypothetical protein
VIVHAACGYALQAQAVSNWARELGESQHKPVYPLRMCNKTTLFQPCDKKNNSFSCRHDRSLDNQSRPLHALWGEKHISVQDSSAEL